MPAEAKLAPLSILCPLSFGLKYGKGGDDPSSLPLIINHKHK